jgi:hypothetical protein
VGELLQVATIECEGVPHYVVVDIAQIICNVVMDGMSFHLVQGAKKEREYWKYEKTKCQYLFQDT